MKILQLCKKFPYPLKDGEAIAINALSKSLHELGCEVSLLCMNTTKHFFEVGQLPSHFDHYKDIQHVEVDNAVKWKDALMNLLTKDSYHITRFESIAFRDRLIQLLRENEYDIIQLETLYLAPYIPYIRHYSKAKVVMRAHNVEHEIWQRITSNTSFLPKKWYLKHLSEKLKMYEVDQLSEYDQLLAITQRDLKRFARLGFQNGGLVVPIGLDINAYQEDRTSFDRELSLSFIGSLDWMPNQEGLEWFLEEVWPVLLQKFPKISLHIAGRNTPKSMYEMNYQNVTIHGEVKDAQAFISQHSIMVVPLLSGSGMRAKILEGMALGKVVLTTRLGLEGIDAEAGREVLVADSVNAYVKRIQYCYDHPSEAKAMGARARAFVHHTYDSVSIARQLAQDYQKMLKRTKATTV